MILGNPDHLHCLVWRSSLHKLQLWRHFLHVLVLLLIDEGVVADGLAHLEVLRLALVVLVGQVLVRAGVTHQEVK